MTFQLSLSPPLGSAPAWVSAQALKKNTSKWLPHTCPIAPMLPQPPPHPMGGHPGPHVGTPGAAHDNSEASKRAAWAALGGWGGLEESPWGCHAARQGPTEPWSQPRSHAQRMRRALRERGVGICRRPSQGASGAHVTGVPGELRSNTQRMPSTI